MRLTAGSDELRIEKDISKICVSSVLFGFGVRFGARPGNEANFESRTLAAQICWTFQLPPGALQAVACLVTVSALVCTVSV